MRYALVTLGLLGCASTRHETTTEPQPNPVAILPAPLTTFDEGPFWFGRSDHSPFGPMPYGLTARRDGERLILRGDVPDGLGMPPGTYQQFTFIPGTPGTPGEPTTLAFETSFTGEVVLGTMVEVARASDKITFCMTPGEGGCDLMTVDFTRVGAGVLFETRREKTPHHRVLLNPARP